MTIRSSRNRSIAFGLLAVPVHAAISFILLKNLFLACKLAPAKEYAAFLVKQL